jgi:hypothetical protein
MMYKTKCYVSSYPIKQKNESRFYVNSKRFISHSYASNFYILYSFQVSWRTTNIISREQAY